MYMETEKQTDTDCCMRHLFTLLPQVDTGQHCADGDVTQWCDGTANRLTLTGPC